MSETATLTWDVYKTLSGEALKITSEQSWQVFQSMPEMEATALRRCCQYQMRTEMREEIGSSDVNHHAAIMIQVGEWPRDRDVDGVEVELGYLVDTYARMLDRDPTYSPVDVLSELDMEEYDMRLPDWTYEGKHLLSREAAEQYEEMRQLFV